MSLLRRFSQKFANFFGENSEADALSESGDSSDWMELDFLADLLPYRLYDSEKRIYENRSSYGFVLEVVPMLGGSLDIQKELSTLVREIGEEGAEIQCLMLADSRIDRFVDSWAAPRKKQGGIFSKIADRKRAFLEKESREGDVPPRIFRFFFSYAQKKSANVTRLVEKRKKALEVFSRMSQAFDMEPLALIELLSGMLNFDQTTATEARASWDQNNWISRQACLPGGAIEVAKDRLVFHKGDREAALKTYEAIDMPDRWSLAETGELIGDFFNASYRISSPFYLHYGIHFPSQEKAQTRFKGKMKVLEHQSKFPSLTRMVPDILLEMEESLHVKQQLLEGEKFVETRLSCGLWAEDARLIKAESTFLALFQKYGFKLHENSFLHLPDFLSSLPMAWGEDAAWISKMRRIRAMRTTLTNETAQLMPCIGEWWGNSPSGMILSGRKGQIATWDPFATEGNLNSVIVGPSGSGKSVFMQEMIMSHLGQGGRIFVLDLGRSFEKLCTLLGGQYLNFSEKSRLDLNPFHLIETEGGQETINAGLEMVSSIVATMAMPSQKIDKERVDILGAMVKAAWEKKGALATIDTIIELMDEMKFQSELMIGAIESLKEGLKKFGCQGVYANYFYGSAPVDFTSDIVVIETEELKNMGDLQSVILQIFTLTISNQIFMGDRNRRCMICIDEAWDLLKSPQMEGFIESLARRLRKYNGALVVGTQSIKDFERSHGARAAFQNSNWLVMLGKDNDSINTLKRDNLIPMDSFKEAALSSLRMESGKYSELFIYHKSSGASSVNQLRLDPFSAALYSTRAEDFQAVQELQAKGMPIEDALEWLLQHQNEFKKHLKNGLRAKEAVQQMMRTDAN